MTQSAKLEYCEFLEVKASLKNGKTQCKNALKNWRVNEPFVEAGKADWSGRLNTFGPLVKVPRFCGLVKTKLFDAKQLD
jgi:hypothetical protein